MTPKPLLAVFLAIGLLSLMGCSSSPTSSGYGELRLTLIDSPSAVSQVNIVVTKVEVHSSGSDSLSGWVTVRSDTATYDLLQLQNGANAILGDKMLPAGKYTQIRLTIGSGSNVMIGTTSYPLDISAASTIKLNNNFTIVENTLYQLTLDFNADKSIVLTGGNNYKLQPVIRVEAAITSGTISGTVSPAAARASVSAILGVDTVTTNCDTTTGAFKLMALPAGTYSVLVAPTNVTYHDTTISNVVVTAQANTDLGTIVVH